MHAPSTENTVRIEPLEDEEPEEEDDDPSKKDEDPKRMKIQKG